MLVFTYSHNNNDKETIVKSQVKGYNCLGQLNIWGVVTASVLSGFFQTECHGRFQNSHQSNFQLSVESNPGLNWFCFTVLFDWSRKLAPPSQPIRCKLKPIAPWSLAFSRATGRLHAFTSSCHWLPLIISFTLIGRCDYFGFGFRHLIEKRSIKGKA